MTCEAVDRFWAEFCRRDTSVDRDESFQVWHFGNSPAMAKDLAGLVVAGKKTATASLVRVNELNPAGAPVLGGLSVVTDYSGNPCCVLETTEIRHIPFDQVDPAFAADEGEGDLSLEYWRRVHADYFRREAAGYEFEFDEHALICCERFRLLYP